MPSDTRAAIYKAFDFTRRVGGELDALFIEIESCLGNAFKNTPWSESYVKRQTEWTGDSKDWICEGWLKEFDVKEKQRRDVRPKSVGILSYIFDLAIQGARSEVLSKSLMGVAWGGAGGNFKLTFPDDLKNWEYSKWSST